MPKRFLFLLLIILINPILSAQSVLVDNSFNWTDWESSLTSDVKMEIVSKIDDGLIDELKNSAFYPIESIIDNFHIVDFNNDGYSDVIYHGFAGTESDRTVFFINNEGKLIKILDLFGNIVEIWRNEPYLPISFKLIDYPCCENYTYSVETYVPSIEGRDNFNFVLSNKVNYIKGTFFPPRFHDRPVLFKVSSEKYTLRTSPLIDNTSNNDFVDTKGNIIAQYPEGTLGIALAEQEDDTGRVWWFVMVLNNKNPLNSIIKSGNNPGSFYAFGWMSNRYLVEIK